MAGMTKFLIVEDEFLVSMLLEDMLEDLGYRTEVASTVKEALSKIDQVDYVLLDINLKGETTYPVADLLIERNIDFAFMTGMDQCSIHPGYSNECVLSKPFTQHHVGEIVAKMISGQCSRSHPDLVLSH